MILWDCWKLSAKLSFWFYQCLILLLLMLHDPISMFHCPTILCKLNLNRGRILVKCLTAEWEVRSSIPGVGPILRILKWLRNEGITFALLQMARPLRGSDAWPRKRAVVEVKIVSPIITFVLNTLTLKLSAFLVFLFSFFISNHFRSSGLPVSHKFKRNITWVFGAIFKIDNIVRSLSAKYRPDRYRRDKSVKFGTELP